VSDIDIVVVDSLKALDPKWPIREVRMSAWSCRRPVPIKFLAIASAISLFNPVRAIGRQS
jgi:hypothetical protein